MEKIAYSHSWEDYSLINEAFNIKHNDFILGIASAGESIFSMSINNPKQIIAIDSNKSQIYLVKLKIISIKYLSYEDMLYFFGFENSKNRINIYYKLKKYLNQDEVKFWNNNLDLIEKGIIHSGKLENYFKSFRKYILPFVISKRNINFYIKSNSTKEQEKIYNKHWNNMRWKFLFKIFFSKTIMKLLGRNKNYFEQTKINQLSKYYFKKAENGIINIPIKKSYFNQYILLGNIENYGELIDHPYLNKNNFNNLKKSISNIQLKNIGIVDYLKNTKNKFNKVHLSDIFEGFKQGEYENLLKLIVSNSNDNGIICYWNNLADRFQHNIKYLKYNNKSSKLFEKDKTFFYSRFIVDEVRK